ncbi:MAG TPA: tripartite tricarboxylate transporter substrate binding protein [Burkholderiales bacterium]|nr:tripartite tricarboxylate transporter substrate binding protein [Burkholderiales bacterium]
MSIKPLVRAVAAAFAFGAASLSLAQAYPTKPVRIILPFAPGGSLDSMGRLVFDKASQQSGHQFVIDYRPGASGNIGTELVARAAPDGYTNLINTLPLVVNPSMFKKLPFDVAKDFAPVSLIASAPFVMVVHPSVPAKTVKEFIALAKSHPGKLNYSSAGIGTNLHVAAELFKNLTKTDIVHIGYKGGGPALIALLSGEAELSFLSIPTVAGHMATGKLRGLAVTGTKRVASLPKLPTVAETVPGYEFASWWGVLAPAGTPPAIVNALNEHIAKAVRAPDVMKRFKDEDTDVIASSPAQFAAHIKTELARWAKVVRDNKIEPQ